FLGWPRNDLFFASALLGCKWSPLFSSARTPTARPPGPGPSWSQFFLFTRSANCILPSRACAYVHTGTCGTTGTILMNQWVVGPSYRARSHSLLGRHDDSATPAMAADRDSVPSLGLSGSAPPGSDLTASTVHTRSAGWKERHRC